MPGPNNKAANGSTIKKRIESIECPTVDQLMELPPWLQALRDAMHQSVSPADVGEIMSVQVQKAKEGNTRAAGFVLKQVEKMAASARPEITITQNNFYGEEKKRPDTPASDPPKTDGKIEKMQRRAQAGMPVHDARDRTGLRLPMSDEEEREYRHRTAMAESELESDRG